MSAAISPRGSSTNVQGSRSSTILNRANPGPTTPTQVERRGSPITFGIEIEAVLAFHQSRLQSVLDTYYSGVPIIVKDISHSDHSVFVGREELSHRCRELHPSWALNVPHDRTLDTTLGLVADEARNILGRNRTLRKYLAEPLIIAKEILEQTHQLPADVRAEICPTDQNILLAESAPGNSIILRAPNADTSKWTLTTDRTLIGLTQTQLHEAIGDGCMADDPSISPESTGTRERVWDSTGFELISPILRVSNKNTELSTVSSYFDALSVGEGFRLLPSPWAALQVHIGLDFDRSEDAPKLLLQHLAYILICHEDLISRLHPRIRCGLPRKGITIPDEPAEFLDEDEPFDTDAPYPEPPTVAEIRLEDDPKVSRAESTYTGSEETRSNRRYFMHNLHAELNRPPYLQDICERIFNPDQSVPELIALLQKPALKGHPMNRNRGYMYNFNNITSMFVGSTWKTPKPTIEFRQHACSTDPVEVRMWVDFCLALVKLAERMANNTIQQRSGLPREQLFPSNMPEQHQSYAEHEGRKYESWTSQPLAPGSIAWFLGPTFLGLDNEAVQFWSARYDQYENDRPTPDEVDESEQSHREEFGV